MAVDTPPVLLLLYNRPDTSKVVLDAIRKARPDRLFVAADGPSVNREQDHRRCAEARALVESIDWDCDVKTLFRDENLGCQKAISSAISWFFEQVEEGIILEDDCLPSQSFFRFCGELLERYRYHDDVMVISGDNFQDGRSVTDNSYYFSRYPHGWGWATWRRAWQKYDAELQDWPSYRESDAFLKIGADSPAFKAYWSRNFERALSGEVDSWAYIWTFSCWVHMGLTAIPNRNLVKNIGFGPDATHTKGANTKINAMVAEEIDFPLRHPPEIARHAGADRYSDINHFGIPLQGERCFLDKLKGKMMTLISRTYGVRRT
jgi:hypothetical protein